MTYKLSPSILAADFSRLGDQVESIDKAGAHMVHIDVMDGQFVPNISFGSPIMSSIRNRTDKIFDVHLMIEEPDRYIEDFVKAGADIITVHAEATKHLHRTVGLIKELGVKSAVALNPATSLNVLEHVIDDLDMVLLMTVNPGFGGQKFIENSIDKIKKLREMANTKNIQLDIQVDGGINQHNVKDVIKAGANVIVAGSAVFNNNINSNVEEFLSIFNEFED